MLCLIAGTVLLCSPRADGPSATLPAAPTAMPTPAPSPAATPDVRSSVGFRSAAQLADHFARHGAEFNASSAAAYVALAQALRDAPVGGLILEIVRPTDGVISRFDRQSGAFGAFNADGTIRTFFKPNDGEAYFRRQARRRPQS